MLTVSLVQLARTAILQMALTPLLTTRVRRPLKIVVMDTTVQLMTSVVSNALKVTLAQPDLNLQFNVLQVPITLRPDNTNV